MATETHFMINNRKLSQFESLPDDIELKNDENYLFDLSHMAVLSAEGDKAAEFLQGQYTCDVSEVRPDQIRQGLRCNLKGRIMGTADIFLHHGLKLLMPADLQESTIKALMKTAAFSKVTIKEDHQWQLFGFYLQNKYKLLPAPITGDEEPFTCIQFEHGCIYALGKGLYTLILKKNAPFPMLEKFQDQKLWKSGLAWHKLWLQSGRIDIYENGRDLFLPHRLELHLKDYISFNKGCYKGQEIIARTHFKAKLKHQLQLFMIETQTSLFSGQKVFDMKNEREIAELIDFSPIDNNRWLVALTILKDIYPEQVIIKGENQELINLEPYNAVN